MRHLNSCMPLAQTIDGEFNFLLLFNRLPWNQHTLFGWFSELIFSACTGSTFIIVNSAVLSFFIGIYLYHRAYYQCICALLDRLNDTRERWSGQTVKLLLADIARFHSSATNIFLQSANFFSMFILNILICSIIYTTSTIFQLDLVNEIFE